MRTCIVLIGIICIFSVQAAGIDPMWRQNYESGVPAEINPDQYRSLNDLFDESFSKYKELPAFTNMGKTISYAELDTQSRHFAAFLQSKLHFVKGERFAIMLPNLLQYPVAIIGVLRAGGIIVNVNPLLTAPELEHQLVASGATGIIVLENFAHIVAKVMPNTQLKQVIVTRAGDSLNSTTALAVNFNVKYIKKMVPEWHLSEYFWYKDALTQGATAKYSEIKLSGNDVAFLQYTGGTTGLSKGAMLTHRNLVANTLQSIAMLVNLVTPRQEILITAIPMYHAYAVTANFLTAVHYGALNVLITNPRDTKAFVKELRKHKFTSITGVNTMFNSLLNHPDFAAVDFSSLKISMSGGMPLQKDVADRWLALTHRPLIEVYGLTESSPAVCMNPLNSTEYNGSIGVPIPSTEISIRDDSNHESAVGTIGELYIRGPQVMAGYWRQDAETAQVLSADGWLATGDIVKIDAHGFVYLIDRKKDMLNVSGFKVYPNEVESVITAMPGVLEVAIIGVKNPQHGEIIKAFIVKKDNTLSEAAILDYCRQHLTRYKIPKIVEFRDSLPKSNLNKILRRELRENG